MKTIIVHLGTHKTGTTSIQVHFSYRRPQFAQHGILYPKTGCPAIAEYGHHLLAWSMYETEERFPTFDGRAAPYSQTERENLWQELIEEIEGSDCDTVVLSSEDFDQLTASEVAGVLEALKDYVVVPVLFIKNTPDLIESAYKTTIVYTSYTETITEFAANLYNRLDYSVVMDNWTAGIASREAHILCYDEPEVRKDVVKAFMDRAFGDLGPETASRNERMNEGVPTPIVAIARFLRLGGATEQETKDWIDRISPKFQSATKSNTTLLGPDLYQLLEQNYRNELTSLLEAGRIPKLPPIPIYKERILVQSLTDALLNLAQ